MILLSLSPSQCEYSAVYSDFRASVGRSSVLGARWGYNKEPKKENIFLKHIGEVGGTQVFASVSYDLCPWASSLIWSLISQVCKMGTGISILPGLM